MSGEGVDLSGFDSKPGEGTDLVLVSHQLHEFLSGVLPRLTESMVEALLDAMHAQGIGTTDVPQLEYDESYSLKDEMTMMLVAVRAMRNEILDGDRLRKNVGVKDLKEFLTSSSSITSTLMKNHEKLMSMERHRAIEQATIETLKEIGGDEVVDRFLALMGAKLS